MKLSPFRKAAIEQAKKAQTSALFAYDEDLAHRDDFERRLILAKRHFDLAKQAQRSALDNAKKCGYYLNKAKGIWKRVSTNRWLKLLKREFPYGGHRNAQNYMQIAREWARLRPIRKENPHLSIDSALRFLRHGTVEKQRTFNYYDFAVSVEWSRMLKETWRSWPQELKDWVREDVERFREMMNQLKFEAIRKNVPRARWGKYATPEELKQMQRQLYAAGDRAIRIHLLGYRDGIASTKPAADRI